MRTVRRGIPLLAAILIMTTLPANAAFNAAELVYVPAAANNAGVEGSFWQTDLTITSVETEANVDVFMYFLPTNQLDNSDILADRSRALGGRASDGFGIVEERLANIPPNGSVLLQNVLGEYFEEEFGSLTSLGALVIFCVEAGTLDPEESRVYRNMVVHTRQYNTTTILVNDPENEGETIEQEVTYGQTLPGVPWYNLADATIADLSVQTLIGASSNEVFRTNFGILNASDRQTSITVAVTPRQENGEVFLNEAEQPIVWFVQLAPLQHSQRTDFLDDTMGLGDVDNVSLHVALVSFSTQSTDPKPMFTSYASLIDGRSNDATTLLPSYAIPYDIDCIWNPDPPVEGTIARQPMAPAYRSRPLEIPSR